MNLRTHLTLVALGLSLTVGCTEFSKVVTSAGVSSGTLTEDQAKSINRSAEVVEKTFKDITPEQEYYIGRSVAANLFATYKPFDEAEANRYVNRLGQTLAQASDRPETFGGYHFQVIQTDEINAFAAPGGLILVSRGLIRCCRSEDALAAVLAHEVAHVEKQHGLKAIKNSRLTSGLTILAAEAGKTLGGEKLAEVTKAFEGSIGDVVHTLATSGYSRTQEFEADAAAVQILRRVGYSPEALVDMLEQMQKKLKPGNRDFGATHPQPKDRIEALRKVLGEPGRIPHPEARQQRFSAFLGRI